MNGNPTILLADLLRARLEYAKKEGERAEAEARLWAEDVKAVETLLSHDLNPTGKNGVGRLDLATLRTMSVRNALVEIAKHNAGFLTTRNAVRLLRQAQVFASEAEARDNIYSTLSKSKDFRKQQRGVYLLVPQEQQSELDIAKRPKVTLPEKPKPGLAAKVESIKATNPDWKAPKIAEVLQTEAWDFHGKHPIFAVCMALGKITLKRKQALQERLPLAQ